jgi:hypothetical protein
MASYLLCVIWPLPEAVLDALLWSQRQVTAVVRASCKATRWPVLVHVLVNLVAFICE